MRRGVEKLDVPADALPEWEAHLAEHRAGVPLLSNRVAAVDLGPAAPGIATLVPRLEPGSLPAPLAAELTALGEAVRGGSGLPAAVVDWLAGDESEAVPSPGLLRFLGWAVLARFLRPVVEAFGRWRDEERWLRTFCPTCGSAPAMAQIADRGLKRMAASMFDLGPLVAP